MMNRLLDRCALSIAAFDENDDDILGWAVTSSGAVHYVYVSADYRRAGIASMLLAPYTGKPTIYTFPPSGRKLGADVAQLRIPDGWAYNPWHAIELAGT